MSIETNERTLPCKEWTVKFGSTELKKKLLCSEELLLKLKIGI